MVSAPLKALLVDAWYDAYLGVVVLVRVIDGTLKSGQRVKMMQQGSTHLIDRIGVDNAMWSSDYPHMEGTRSFSRSSVAAVFDALGEEDAKKVVGGNAAKLFGF